ncbi:hypothetical protein TNCV_929931 [Trichonephila clavipes]|uniref:Uncharacterized protein n=1 Tax=Trichonephila clavipes TaxID=2585209 RepID=A0A8X7BDV4_TRICX|nr:hypothetical protein TNCV_929931 [Trichonephila clavipes]
MMSRLRYFMHKERNLFGKVNERQFDRIVVSMPELLGKHETERKEGSQLRICVRGLISIEEVPNIAQPFDMLQQLKVAALDKDLKSAGVKKAQ